MKLLSHLRTNWFKYGFETIAVVVGILAAFALDNWNEDRKQEILEIQYLNGLKADLASDTVYYARRIADSEQVIQDNNQHIRLMYQIQESLEEVKNLLSLANWNSEQLTTQNSSYIDLTNSGSLGMISNPVLRDLIINYYSENDRASAHIIEFNEVSSRTLLQVGFVIQNYNKFNHLFDDLYADETRYVEGEWAFINDPTSDKFRTLENAIMVYRLKHTEFLNHFITLKKLAVQLIEGIQIELYSREN